MTRPSKCHAPATYQLRVAAHLDDHWSPWFGDLILAHDSDGTTTLTGVVPDQAELHGLLMKVRDLGVTLISVAMLDPVDHQPGPSRPDLSVADREDRPDPLDRCGETDSDNHV